MACRICFQRLEQIKRLRSQYRQLSWSGLWRGFELAPNGRVKPKHSDRIPTENELRGAAILEWVIGEAARIDSCCGSTERKRLLPEIWPDFPFEIKPKK